MKDWNYEKNKGLDPEDFMPGSNKKVWWKCSECGYEYSALINNRNKGTGCKRCAGQVLIPGENDLETKYPEMAAEWDYEKNDLLPSQVFANSNIKFFWKCKLGHEWEAAPNHRARGSGCPVCAGNVVLKGFNDLTTTHPEIAAKWHPTKNGSLLPTQVSKGHKNKVWFQCPDCGKAYDTCIGNVVKGYGRCPYCTTRKSAGKYVYQVETGKYFNTLKEATESIGKTDIRLIQMCCKGRCKTAYGYHWEYRTKE
jgi:DNA-directed RNA polymerase subunit RPC12/RpoP